MMQHNNLPEVWLRGPLPDVPAMLQPAAHALLQAEEEINNTLAHFPESLIWQRPAAVASIAFHLQHITGVLDRLVTYADARQLSTPQMDYLTTEGEKRDSITLPQLLHSLHAQIQSTIKFFITLEGSDLSAPRYVGRKKLPSTIIGLLFHAAEHTQRHTGQLLVTARILLETQGVE